jgi:hypothetical protein
VDSRRYSVSREDNGCTFWNFIGFIYEDDATLFKSRDHMLVVDDLFADVHRSSIEFE